jgi:hypothetical protein
MKTAKVIATCLKRSRVVEKTGLVGDPLGFFHHSQNFVTMEKMKNLFNFLIDLEKKSDPGCEMDLIIVNNDVGEHEGNKFLENFDNQKIFNGKIRYLCRENSGMSFGAYNEAYKKFKSEYDYFLFCEDDISIYKKDYYTKGISYFKNNEDCGFVAYIHSTKLDKPTRKRLNLTKKGIVSCHGAIGLSSVKVLDIIADANGNLPFNNVSGENYLDSIVNGEIGFPLKIVKKGFKILDFPREVLIAEPTYDLMRNITVRKFPTFVEKMIYYFKYYVHSFFSLNNNVLRIYYKFLKLFKN